MNKRKLDVAFLLNEGTHNSGACMAPQKKFHAGYPEPSERTNDLTNAQKPMLPSISSMLSVAPAPSYHSYQFYTQHDSQWPLVQHPFHAPRRASSVPDISQPAHEQHIDYDFMARRTSMPAAKSTAEVIRTSPQTVKKEEIPSEKNNRSSPSSSIKFVMHMEQFGGSEEGGSADEGDHLSTDEVASAAFETQNEEEFKKSLSKELPVRVLAYALGLNSDPQKGWRYRDIKRLLFDNLPKDQHEFIKKNNKHKLLIQRLPNRLTMEQFCKRIALLVFHFVLRDGREPKFWRRDLTRRDMLERVLKQTAPAFWDTTCTKVAMIAHALAAGGASLEEAVFAIEKKKDLNAFYAK